MLVLLGFMNVVVAQYVFAVNLHFYDEEICAISTYETGNSWNYTDGTIIPLNHSCVAVVCLASYRRLELMGCAAWQGELPMNLGGDKSLYPYCCP
ncbi:hypothetical protein MTO96_023851 [Rhipicephalus appendiculatus]